MTMTNADHQPAIYAAQALEMTLKRHQFGNASDADLEAAWQRLLALRWPDLEDVIEEAISDSLEMDWLPRDGARAVVHTLLPPPVEAAP